MQVRTQPLPAGRYWITIRPGRLDTFRAWAASNPTRIAIESSEASGAVTFFLFRVLKPIRFDQRSFGFPNTAGADVQHASDTAQRPPVPTIMDTVQEAIDAATGTTLGKAAVVLGLLYALGSADGKK